ncbi:hypothetical protein K466DRAFT_585422 [Polyporus arcularius HHB13444]|uniref:Uncharacterized protein n=1 Tax=Polyporus arcularius HHB13444 TaxID=1314778 RepID=A0A5C3PK78_9APHY|nr:hypothetical protein K466DRAFT_585422 [Polyporus arcularius HHB13444]
MALFALAALAVMNSPHDLLFWAFWGLKSEERTAELVDEVIHTNPPLITLPMSVVWESKASALAGIEESRRPLLPKAVHPIQYISSNLHLLMKDPKPMQSAKRKQPSADVDDDQPVAKRLRTRVAKPKVPACPSRKSTRLRKSAATPASHSPHLQTKLVVLRRPQRAELRRAAGADVVVDVEEAPAQGASGSGPTKKRTTTMTTPRRKATSARKRPAAKKSAATVSPKQAVAAVPQEAAWQPTPSSSRRIENSASAPSSSGLEPAPAYQRGRVVCAGNRRRDTFGGLQLCQHPANGRTVATDRADEGRRKAGGARKGIRS